MLTFQKKNTGGKADEVQRKDQSPLISSEQSTLWLSKHKPTTVKDLALHSSRVLSCSMTFNYFNTASLIDFTECSSALSR
jgi:hypothetical protein